MPVHLIPFIIFSVLFLSYIFILFLLLILLACMHKYTCIFPSNLLLCVSSFYCKKNPFWILILILLSSPNFRSNCSFFISLSLLSSLRTGLIPKTIKLFHPYLSSHLHPSPPPSCLSSFFFLGLDLTMTLKCYGILITIFF